MRRPLPQKKILPPQMQRPSRAPQQRRPLPNSKNNELDDVLKKLKEMGK
jgi:hypothetical protein